MKKLFFIALLLLMSFEAHAVVVFDQTLGASSTLLQSSSMDPNGSDYDQYVWDKFSKPMVLTTNPWSMWVSARKIVTVMFFTCVKSARPV